ELGQYGGPEGIEALTAAVVMHTPAIERDAGNAGTMLIQRVCRLGMAVLLQSGKFKSTVVLLLLSAAKGRRFAAMLAKGTPVAALERPEFREWERDIAQLRLTFGPGSEDDAAPFEEERLLTSFVTPGERHGGS